MPKVSVIIPAYNCERFIGETLQSVLNQSFQDFEILVVDDGSTDGTGAAIKAFDDARIQYFHQANSGRPASPRNKAIRESRGEYIFFFDSDDVMLPGKLSTTVSALDEAPASAGLAFTAFSCIDEAGFTIEPDFLERNVTLKKCDKQQISGDLLVIEANIARKALVKSNFVGTSSVAVRRKVFETVPLFSEQLKNSDDALMWQSIACYFDFVFIPNVLHQYRVRSDSISLRRMSERGPGIIEALDMMKTYHRDDPDSIAILDQKIARAHYETGYSHFDGYELSDARLHLYRSLKKHFHRNALKYFLLAHLPPVLIRKLRALRWKLGSN